MLFGVIFQDHCYLIIYIYSAFRLRADTWLSLAFSLFLFNAYSFHKNTNTARGILFRTLAIFWSVSKHVSRTGSVPAFRKRNEIFI